MMRTVSAGREREEDGEPGVLPERLERLGRAVRARRQPVGAEPDPGEDRDQRDLVEGAGITRVLRRADEDARDLGAEGRLGHRKDHACSEQDQAATRMRSRSASAFFRPAALPMTLWLRL